MNTVLMIVQMRIMALRIKGYKIRGLPFLITFIITVVFFVVAFDFFGIEFNDRVTIAVLGFGLMSGGFVSMWRKGLLHQGHFSIIVGLIFLVLVPFEHHLYVVH